MWVCWSVLPSLECWTRQAVGGREGRACQEHLVGPQQTVQEPAGLRRVISRSFRNQQVETVKSLILILLGVLGSWKVVFETCEYRAWAQCAAWVLALLVTDQGEAISGSTTSYLGRLSAVRTF